MRILLTGATGFIGQRLGKELVRAGHEVVALVRATTSLPFPAEQRLWKNPGTLENIDSIIHLAGESIGKKRWSEEQKSKILLSRTESTKDLWKLVAEAKGRKPKVLVASSAIGFYGDREDEALNENSKPGAGFLANTCSAWEKESLRFREILPRVVILRTGVVLGKDGGALTEMLPIFRKGLGGKLGSGNQWMSWIHIEDIVALYQFALEQASMDGIYNAVAPNPVTNREFTKSLGEVLKVPTFFAVPAFALKLAVGEMSELLLGSQRVTEKLRALGFVFRYGKLKEALKSLRLLDKSA